VEFGERLLAVKRLVAEWADRAAGAPVAHEMVGDPRDAQSSPMLCLKLKGEVAAGVEDMRRGAEVAGGLVRGQERAMVVKPELGEGPLLAADGARVQHRVACVVAHQVAAGGEHKGQDGDRLPGAAVLGSPVRGGDGGDGVHGGV